MERDTAGNEALLSSARGNKRFTLISNEYNREIVKQIARSSGSEAVKNAHGWLEHLIYLNKDKFYFINVDNVAFCGGSFGKKHFRLAELVVAKEYQHQGYGTEILKLLKKECFKRGVSKITLRTSKDETAYEFYSKLGGAIVGAKDNDYEMEINV